MLCLKVLSHTQEWESKYLTTNMAQPLSSHSICQLSTPGVVVWDMLISVADISCWYVSPAHSCSAGYFYIHSLVWSGEGVDRVSSHFCTLPFVPSPKKLNRGPLRMKDFQLLVQCLPWVEVSLFSREKEEISFAIFDRTKISSFQRKLRVGSG